MDQNITTWLIKYFDLNMTKNTKYQNLQDADKIWEEFLLLNTRQKTAGSHLSAQPHQAIGSKLSVLFPLILGPVGACWEQDF